jgi:hypothetical protein
MTTIPIRLSGLAACALSLVCACASEPGAGDGVGRSSPNDADQWLGVDRGASFLAHVAQIRAIEVISEASLGRLGTTWERELGDVERMYRDARTADQAYYALVALANSFHDGHAYFRIDELEPAGPEVTLPFSVRVEYVDGVARYIVRPGGSLPAGAEVLELDGRAVGRLEGEWRRWFPGNSPEGLREGLAQWMSTRSPRREPSPTAGSTTTIIAQSPGGPRTPFTLTWKANTKDGVSCPPYADPCAPDADGEYADPPSYVGLGYCVYGTPQEGTRIVRYRTFYAPDTSDPTERACLAKKLPSLSYELTLAESDRSGPRGLLQRDQGELLDHLARRAVRRVLFDVRENTGGDFDPGFFGAFTSGSYAQPLKRFVYKPWFREDASRIRQANVFVALLDGSPVDSGAAAIEDFLRKNPSSEASPPLPFYCQTQACAEAEARLESRSNVVFAAALLVGPKCFSACDDFVSIFRDNGLARTIGQPSGAGDSPYSYDVDLPLAGQRVARAHLTVGVSFHPGTGVPLEGHPAFIDVPLPPTAENRGRYVAEALARAPF